MGSDIVKHETNPPIIEGLAVSPLVKAKACCFPSLKYYTSVFYPSSITGTLLPPLVSLPQEPFFFMVPFFYNWSLSYTTVTVVLPLELFLYHWYHTSTALEPFLQHWYTSSTIVTLPLPLQPVLHHWNPSYCTGTLTLPLEPFIYFFTVSVLLEPFLQHW